jgi:hypothetical protein
MGLTFTVEGLTDSPASGDLNGRYQIRLRVEKSPLAASAADGAAR